MTDNLIYNLKPMHYNNRAQNRIATCNAHNNFFGAPPGGPMRSSGKVGKALLCDGVSSFESVPHSEKFEPKNLTVEAWIQLDEYPAGEDPRSWIVNKNTHEFAESHYALVIDGKKVAAYLNIGGGQQNYHDA